MVHCHIHSLALITFYRCQHRTIAANGKRIVVETPGIVIRYYVNKQHHLVLVIGVEELLGYQRVELYKVYASVAFAKGESVGELTFELALCIVNLHGNSSVIRSILHGGSIIIHRICPYVAIGTIDGAECLCRREHLIGSLHSRVLAGAVLEHGGLVMLAPLATCCKVRRLGGQGTETQCQHA